jgi:penicillin-insensitive murein endopeptidase
MRWWILGFFTGVVLVVADASRAAVESTCHGTAANGSLENGVKLPEQGRNFTAYRGLAGSVGRTWVHSRVAEILAQSYAALERTAPGKLFVYGETGFASGGRFRPHRTHRNGLSVNFFVPVVDAKGGSVKLPTGFSNKFGYAIEFDETGRAGDFTIDFEAMAEHLHQLDLAAKAHGSGIKQVIFDPPYLPKLFATRSGPYLKENVAFMQGKAWVRHDEHYHVDFAVPCAP